MRLVLAAAAAVLLLFVSACDSFSKEEAQQSAGMSGGDASLSGDVNLREVSVELQGDKTIVHLNFINGSRNSGVEESKLSAVPSYAVTQLYDPARIQIALAIGFADYASLGTVFKDSVVDGIFDCPISGSRQQLLFLQLSGPVSVECSASGSVLTLELTPRSVAARTAWYVGLDDMEAFERGRIPESLGYTPSMCEGYASTILLSDPLKSQEEAESFRNRTIEELPPSVSPDNLYVFSMRTDQLPPPEDVESAQTAQNLPVIERDGEPQVLPVLLDDGAWLTQTESGTIYYAVPFLPGENADVENVVKQELWQRSGSRPGARVLSERFYDIQQAAASPDGRLIGILDARTDSQLLYVYDRQTGTLFNLGEEGFGDYTVSFLWQPEGNVICAMTGTAAELHLLRYDFEAADPAERVSAVGDWPGSESAISYADGRVYFTDQQTATVCAADLATGQRTDLGEGVDCLVSPDGSALAVLQMQILGEMDVAFRLVIMDPATGAIAAEVQEEAQIESFMFAPSTGRLLWTVQGAGGETGEFPFLLQEYSPTEGTQTLFASRTERILPAPAADVLYLICSLPAGERTKALLPVTYAWSAAED